jgi:hypothetical protein
MRRHLVTLIALPALLLTVAPAVADSWIFQPSLYSHDPYTCERVNQFQPEQASFAREDPTYMESGYRHLHTSILGADGSYDHTHVVQTWGAGESIRPYGEWQFPFRAGATPFGPWGNPQGPWTLPFDSWQNPYGLGRLPNLPGMYGSSGGYGSPGGYGNGSPYGTAGPSPYGFPRSSHGPLQSFGPSNSPSPYGPLRMPGGFGAQQP